VVNADSVERAPLSGAIQANQNSNTTLFSGIRDNGVAENDRTNLNFIAGTNTTASVTDDSGNDELEVRFSVEDFPLSGLADQAANTYLANATTGTAPPTAIAVSAESIPARTSGNLTQVTSSAQSILMRSSGSLFFGTAAADQVLRRSGSGDLGFGTLVAGNIGDGQVTLAKLANIATDSLIGRDTTGTGAPENITLNTTLSMTGSGSLQRSALTGEVTASAGSNATSITRSTNFTWTGDHQFNGEVDIGSHLSFDGVASVLLSSNQNNFNIGTNSVLMVQGATGSQQLTGMVAPSKNKLVFILNDSTQAFVLPHNSASSTGANRFSCPSELDYVLEKGGALPVLYSTARGRWCVLSGEENAAA
jgi:hypothetical protein